MFAAMRRSDGGIAVNFYEPLTLETEVGGTALELKISGNYPDDGAILLEISPEYPVEFTLALRIPGWCSEAELEAGGKSWNPAEGRYAELRRVWSPGNRIRLTLPMPIVRIPAPDGSSRFAVRRGPVLLVQDSRIGSVDAPCILPEAEPVRIPHAEIAALYEWPDGTRLCDYASAGNQFRETNTICVWLKQG